MKFENNGFINFGNSIFYTESVKNYSTLVNDPPNMLSC